MRRELKSCPCFMPDATRAAVRGLDSRDLDQAGVEAVMANAFHLARQPGTGVIGGSGGLHSFMDWDRPLWTDSGGFQVYSLIRENPEAGQVTGKGFAYRDGKGKKTLFTPAKSMTIQWRLGSDAMFCLDQCTHPDDSPEIQNLSVERTISWAAECKEVFLKRIEQSGMDAGTRPLLFAVVQGGQDRELRRRCASELLEIGFDGFGFGGWPIDGKGKLVDAVGFLRDLIPREFPLHGLGIGNPANVAAAFGQGYSTFDSTLPGRDARRGRLMVSSTPPDLRPSGTGFFRYLYIMDEKFSRDSRPVEEGCPCMLCMRHGRSYLHHLFKVRDHGSERLATIHNLTFMSRLTSALGASKY